MDIKKTTLGFPTWLHKAIKQESLDTDRSMTEIIIEQMAERYPKQKALFFTTKKEVKLLIKEDIETLINGKAA